LFCSTYNIYFLVQGFLPIAGWVQLLRYEVYFQSEGVYRSCARNSWLCFELFCLQEWESVIYYEIIYEMFPHFSEIWAHRGDNINFCPSYLYGINILASIIPLLPLMQIKNRTQDHAAGKQHQTCLRNCPNCIISDGVDCNFCLTSLIRLLCSHLERQKHQKRALRCLETFWYHYLFSQSKISKNGNL
jgi:hypothetical protein